jgi:hypothetical protein
MAAKQTAYDANLNPTDGRSSQQLTRRMAVHHRYQSQQQHGGDSVKHPVIPIHQLTDQKAQAGAGGYAQALAQLILSQGVVTQDHRPPQ